MPQNTAPLAQRPVRLALSAALIALPAIGLHSALSHGPAQAPGAEAGVALASLMVHVALLGTAETGLRRATVWLFLSSSLAMLALAGVALLAQGPQPLHVALAWGFGALLAMLCRSLRLLAGRFGRSMLHPAQILLCLLATGAGFWLGDLALRRLAGMAGIPPAGLALAALYGTVGIAIAAQSLARMGQAAVLATPARIVLAGAGAVAVVLFAALAPDADLLGAGGTGVMLLVLLIPLAQVIAPLRSVILGAFLAYLGGSFAFAGLATAGPGLTHGLLGLALVAILTGLARGERARHTTAARRIGDPAPETVAGFHDATRNWLIACDLDSGEVTFPLGGHEVFGTKRDCTVSELFARSDLSGVLALMSRLHDDSARGEVMSAITLMARPPEPEAKPVPTPFAVHLIAREGALCWLGLRSQENNAALIQRIRQQDELLTRTLLREERLLSITSHELRTPIAILSMLTEELKSGLSWEDVGPSFDKTLERIVAVLDDLRADTGAEGGLAAASTYTLREISDHLLGSFHPAAEANGIALTIALPQNGDTPLRGDRGRFVMALSKLLHNAILHSRGTEVTVTAFLVQGADDAITVTWQVADNGIGIGAAEAERIFEPFETGGGSDHPGLGLYTARKAVRLIGGDLVLHKDPQGSRFVLTYPARSATLTLVQNRDALPMPDLAPEFPATSILLIEDNPLVGEMTSSRLQKLAGTVRWAKSGPEGLAMYREARPDILLVDQLLPGLSGSEIVREIRKEDKDLPIVGITASTMGSECIDLENAGADLALEKPLSFVQLRSIVGDFVARRAG